MPQTQYHIKLITATCILTYLTCPTNASAKARVTNNVSANTAASDSSPEEKRLRSVEEWFNRYDQIRRDAEMTMGDKLQSLLLAAKKPEKKNAALASRMIAKYTTSLSELEKLESIPETRELQQGYIEYFRTARQLFSDYLDAQKAVPFTNQSLRPTKKRLEELDKKIKKIDANLRKQYRVTKHRHS
jgi:hypothetical protein